MPCLTTYGAYITSSSFVFKGKSSHFISFTFFFFFLFFFFFFFLRNELNSSYVKKKTTYLNLTATVRGFVPV